MTTEAPVNAGHRFANMAEDYEENEEWLKAAETHSKAAGNAPFSDRHEYGLIDFIIEQFKIAMQDTTDIEAIRTLKLLSSNHTRRENEAKRKAQRILDANTTIQQKNNKTANSINGVGLLNALNNKDRPPKKNGLMVSRLAGIHGDEENNKIGESYALLSNDGQDDDDDPFNKFLEAVEGLVQQLFNPAVAFTSAPLNENDKPIPFTDVPRKEASHMLGSYFMVSNPDGSEDAIINIQERLNTLTLNNNSDPITDGDDKHYRVENENLRAQIIQLKKRLKALEMSVEENNLLKSSVLQFRNDVHKQAQKIMQSHHEASLRSSSLLGGPHYTGGSSLIQQTSRYPLLHANTNHRPDLLTRLKELEEENKQLTIQNENQKSLMNRHKERWEMLKENAKKRRATPTPTTNAL